MVIYNLFNLVYIIIIFHKVICSKKKIANKENQTSNSKINYKLKYLNYKNKNYSKDIFNNNKLSNVSLFKKSRKLENIEKCAKTDDIGIKNSLCIECNIEGGYYPLYYNYLENKKYEKYLDCYQGIKGPDGFYLNKEIKGFEKCYDSCKTCFGHGNIGNNNCSSCKEGYFFRAEDENSLNCIKKCEFYHYFTLTGNYLCTDNYHCPKEANLIIENLNKCTYDCSYDNNYYYQYNGECLNACPINTHPNNKNICIDDDIEKCVFTKKRMKINGISLNFDIISDMAKRFADEFKYTYNHVSRFITGNYSIIFYKNDSCLSQYKSNYSRIEFDICLQKIYENYNISAPLVAIIDRMGKYNNPSTEFFYFDPISGERLHTNFCDFLSYTVKKNISEINKNKFSYLIDKDIDIYNFNSEFYTSNCNNYNRKFETDITLSYRLLYFYPKISIFKFFFE